MLIFLDPVGRFPPIGAGIAEGSRGEDTTVDAIGGGGGEPDDDGGDHVVGDSGRSGDGTCG